VHNTIAQCVCARSTARLSVVVSVAVAVLATACSDPLAIKASSEVHTDTLAIFSITGTPVGFPSGLNTSLRSAVRIDPSFDFDIAFDIDAQGRAVLIPVRLVGGTVTLSKQVGLHKLTVPFEQLTQAPTSGYRPDSVVYLSRGESVVVQSQSASCVISVNQFLYSKLAIDSVVPATHLVYIRLVSDPNCGFRSLAPGIPKN
jgi:hypothetical protein